jgi:mRNA-degrading endonuclease RelE of RelBE toxin-antitoxin system
MQVEYLASYERAHRKLASPLQQQVAEAVSRLLDYFMTGERPQGLGLRRLRWNYWEIRVGLMTRILFELGRDRVTFVFVGSHDHIRGGCATHSVQRFPLFGSTAPAGERSQPAEQGGATAA